MCGYITMASVCCLNVWYVEFSLVVYKPLYTNIASSDLEEQGTLSSASVDSDAPDDNAGSKPKRAKGLMIVIACSKMQGLMPGNCTYTFLATLKESHKLAKSIKPSSKKGKGANTKRSTKQPAKKANAIVDVRNQFKSTY